MPERLIHIDLFSGIGGFALACRWNGIKTIQFVEIDPFCQKVLRKNFPGVPIHDDIKTYHYGERQCLESVQIAKRDQSQEKGNRIVSLAIQNELPLGDPQILNDDKQQTENGVEKRSMKLSTITGESASVVEKQQKIFLPLTTNTTTEMQNGETINPKRGKSSSSEDYPMIIKSSATTATTQGRIAESAPIRGKNNEPIFLLTAGVPCQPASCAGKRGGRQDDRWLWDEAIRVLAEVKPTWAIFENVAGLLSLESGLVFDDLLSQMENQGYSVQPFVIPACAVGAPHRRDRVWIVANPAGGGFSPRRAEYQRTGRVEKGCGGASTGPCANACIAGLPSYSIGGRSEQGHEDPREPFAFNGCGDRNATDASVKGPQIREVFGRDMGQECQAAIGGPWQEPWPEVAARLCRVDARVSNRVDRLKSLGNAIVPQVAAEIIKAILDTIRV